MTFCVRSSRKAAPSASSSRLGAIAHAAVLRACGSAGRLRTGLRTRRNTRSAATRCCWIRIIAAATTPRPGGSPPPCSKASSAGRVTLAASLSRLSRVCRRARACTGCWTRRARFSTSARRAISKPASGRIFNPATCSRRCRRWSRRRRAWKSRSRIPIPKRCCSNSISSKNIGRASTWCCATTRAFPTCISKPSTSFRASISTADRARSPAGISGRIRRPAPCARHCSSCRSCFVCEIATTPISRTGRAPVCSTRSSAARRLAWG